MSRIRTLSRSMRGFSLVLLFCLLSGCEDEIAPFQTTDFPFTLWGLVNPQADTQAVRVFTITTTLEFVPGESIDASTSIIDVTNQVRHVLQDSITQLPNGDFRHTFWEEFRVDYGNVYRVEIERSDGLLTRSSDVRVPDPVTLSAPDPTDFQVSELVLPVVIEGNPPSLPRVDVTYNSYSADNFGNRLAENPVTISYASVPEFRDNALSMEIDLQEDFVQIRRIFNSRDLQGQICVDNIRAEFHIGNEEWQSPAGVFDPNVLVEPGTLSNVENGFGFFGAGFIETITLIPPATMQVRAGFFDCVGVSGMDANR